MENTLSLLITVSFVLFVIGLFSPKISLFWYKKTRNRKLSALIYGGVLIVCTIIAGVSGVTAGSSSKAVELTQVQKDSIKVADSVAAIERVATDRKKEIEKQFSSWDGSHISLEKYIKKNMNDPDSYEHIETKYWDMKDHLVVLTKFRGKNAFGGKVVNTIKAEVDMQGNVTKIIEQL